MSVPPVLVASGSVRPREIKKPLPAAAETPTVRRRIPCCRHSGVGSPRRVRDVSPERLRGEGRRSTEAQPGLVGDGGRALRRTVSVMQPPVACAAPLRVVVVLADLTVDVAP